MKGTQISFIALAALGLQLASFSQVFEEVYAFTGGADGAGPQNLMQARDGDFYGMTSSGGASGFGAIFQLSRHGKLKTLTSFDGTDNLRPSGPLMEATQGHFYGMMTLWGEADLSGTVFKITRGGKITTMVRFTGKNGAYPMGSLVEGDDGNLYGVTAYGGVDYVSPEFYCGQRGTDFCGGYGTIFRMTPDGALTTLYSFTTNHEEGGLWPTGPLTKARDGNFYGMVYSGANRAPMAYRVTGDGVLTKVASLAYDPHGAVVQASDGNFYGLAGYGSYARRRSDGNFLANSKCRVPFFELFRSLRLLAARKSNRGKRWPYLRNNVGLFLEH